MGFGAFAGGVVKGIQAAEEIKGNRDRLQLEQDRAKREQEDHDYQMSQRSREQEYQQKLADFSKGYWTDDSAPTTTTVNGPSDAVERKFANYTSPDGQQSNFNQQQYDVTTPGTGAGVNPFAPGNEQKLLGYMAGMYKIDAEYGKIDPGKMKELITYRQQLDKDGTMQAIQKYMLNNDPEALKPIANRLGADPESLQIKTESNKYGVPVPMLSGMTKDGQPFKQDMTTVAAVMGLDGYSKAIDTSRDNDRKDAELGMKRDYYNGVLGAKRAKANPEDTYDPELVGKIYKGNERGIPESIVPANMTTGKPADDRWANQKIRQLANQNYRLGGDPHDALDSASDVIDNITSTVLKSNKFKTAEDFNAARQKVLDAAIAKQRAAQAKQQSSGSSGSSGTPSAFPAVAPATQGARDNDRLGILMDELKAMQADPNTKPTDREALLREIGNTPNGRDALARLQSPAAPAAPAAAPAQAAPQAAIQRTAPAAAPQAQSIASIALSDADPSMQKILMPKVRAVDALVANLQQRRQALAAAGRSGDPRATQIATDNARQAYAQLQSVVNQYFPQQSQRILSTVN